MSTNSTVTIVILNIVISVTLSANCEYFEYGWGVPAIPCNICLKVKGIENNITYSYKYKCNQSNIAYINGYIDDKCNIFSGSQSFNAYIHNNNNENNNNNNNTICDYVNFKLFINNEYEI
eukprot:41417_1